MQMMTRKAITRQQRREQARQHAKDGMILNSVEIILLAVGRELAVKHGWEEHEIIQLVRDVGHRLRVEASEQEGEPEGM